MGGPLGTLFTDGVGVPSSKKCFMQSMMSMASFPRLPLYVQLLTMVQREFEKHYRELKRAMKEENDENDMRVRFFCASTRMLDLHHRIGITQIACTEGTTAIQYRALLEHCQGEVVVKEMEIEGLRKKLLEVEKSVKA